VDDGNVGRASVIQDASGTRKKCGLITLCIDGDDAGLTIHVEDGGVSGINTERSGHGHSREAFRTAAILNFLAGSCKGPIREKERSLVLKTERAIEVRKPLVH
jgi:hypothetical protein